MPIVTVSKYLASKYGFAEWISTIMGSEYKQQQPFVATTTIMSSVWVQLSYKGKDEPEGRPTSVKKPKDVEESEWNIDALVKQVAKEELKKELDHAGLTKIDIYPPKSSGDKNKYKPYKEMKEVIAELEKKKTPPTSGKHPLIVVAPAQPSLAEGQTNQIISYNDLYQLVEEAKGMQLTESESQYILTDYAKLIDAIMMEPERSRRQRMAASLWLRLSIRIKTRTRSAVVEQYLFDGPVPGAYGSSATAFQFAVRGTRLYCAKIMLENGNNSLKREYDISLHLHKDQICPTVMRAVDLIHVPGEPKRIAMITPYYPLPLTLLTGGQLHPEGCINVALCGLATTKAFNAKKLCHGDIKPGNMMFSDSAKVITIDFGSVTEYGNNLTYTTPGFGLDYPLEASLSYDLGCLASSLFALSTGRSLPRTVLELQRQIEGIPSASPALQIASLCLSGHDDIDFIWEKAIFYMKDADGLNSSLLIDYESLLPVRDTQRE